MPITPINAPAGFAPEIAIAYAAADGSAQLVTPAAPLPIVQIPFVPVAPLAGFAATGGQAGPFKAQPGRPVILTLSGTWTGQVSLLRSTNNGTTKLALTAMGQPYGVFVANACEPVWEESEADAALYLDLAIASGTLSYRLGQ